MSSGKKVFILGPGFIGLNVLDILVSEGYAVTGSIRREAAAEQLRALGASAVVADIGDHDAIATQTAESDIVFHTATADDLSSVQAVLAGIRTRASRGQHTLYIHTSGAAVLADDARGAFKSKNVYHDDVPAEWDSIPDNAPHRAIDLTIVQAQRELGEKATMAIMLPPLIYGYNPKFDRSSIQIPTLVRFALKNNFAGYIGEGKSAWSTIHVQDLARAYITILHHIETTAGAAAVRANPYFYAENSGDEEPTWADFAGAIGAGLHAAGRLQDPTARTIPEARYVDLFRQATGLVFASNVRTRAVRLRELGWQPQEKDWQRSLVEDELPVLLT